MAQNVQYGATYPKISIDEHVNYPNAQFNIKKITVEEWNDLLHHTHRQSEILDNNGEFIGQEGATAVSAEEVNELKEQVNTLIEQNRALASRITALENAGSSGSAGSDDGIFIGDWDAEKPGIQTDPEDDGEEIIDDDNYGYSGATTEPEINE